MSVPGVEDSMWSSPDADGVITCNSDVGAVSTLRGRRKRRGARQSRSDVQLWPTSWRELLKDWLKQGNGYRRKWDVLLKIAGVHRVHDAFNLLEALLKSGFIEVEELKRSNQWKTLWIEFIALEDFRELIGLPNRDKLQKQREGHSDSIFQSNELHSLHETLDKMPPDRAIRRHDILVAIDRWMSDDNSGTRRDFALYARGDTKAITKSEWDWLESKLCLEDIGISRHTPSVWLRAPLLLTADAGLLNLHAVPDCIGLTPNTIKSVVGISGEINSWRILENRTVFERVARDRGHVDGVIWVPGFAPSWWISSVAHILKLCPAPAFIACDPDPAGIEIAMDICQIWLANDLEWTPWCMNSKSLSGLPKRKKLTEDDLSRLERLRLMSLPGTLINLIGWMMDNGEKGEQEGISFNEP
jgi:hypothetical protein